MKPKERASARDVEAYIQAFPDPVRELLQQVRHTVRKVLPDAEEGLKYGIPSYYQEQNLVHFAGFKRHIGFYPTPPVIEHFKEALMRYKTTKGAIQFPLDEPIPYPLIEEITRFRLQMLRAPDTTT